MLVGAPPAIWPAPQKETRLKLLPIPIYSFDESVLVTLATQTQISSPAIKSYLVVIHMLCHSGTLNALSAVQ
jgi:hypothetical protein